METDQSTIENRQSPIPPYPWWVMIFPAVLLILSWLMACYGGREEDGPVARFALWLAVFLHFDFRLRQIRDRQ